MRNHLNPQSEDFRAAIAGKTEHVDYELVRYADGSVDVLTGSDIPAQTVPESVTPWQMRKALNASGKRSLVDALLANPQTPSDVIDGWEVASEWRRTDPVLLAMAAQLGMTDGEIDDLFTLAASL